MEKKYSVFTTYHPVLLFVYALMAPVLGMMTSHPVYLAANLCMAVVVHGFYFGVEQTGKSAAYMCVFILTVGMLNFCFNTRGMHELFRIGGHPFTLESLLYGLASGAMLASVILWFQCFHKIVSNEKFLYLFGKRLPGTALLLSMMLKLFPDTKYRMKSIQYADKETVRRETPTLSQRLKKGFRHISVLLEWTMEDSIEMADSMKARGYGEGRRSSWQTYRWSNGDCVLAAIMTLLAAVSAVAVVSQNAGLRWYPVIEVKGDWRYMTISAVCYLAFLGLPILAEQKVRCVRRW